VVPLADMNSIPACAVLIQTTSAGFGTQAHISPLPNGSFCRRVDFVLDIIYTPWETVLLRDARAYGAQSANGFDMLVYQAAASYEIWRGIHIDDESLSRILSKLREHFLNGR